MKKTPLLAVGLMATAVLTGCATKADGERNDKLESFNRTMFDFNYKVMDRYVLEPAAKGWRDYVPTPVTKGLSNVANNLDEPVSFVNRLLEGEPKKAFVHFNRFWINSTFGIGGLFDFASASKDLQVYIVLPIYNATTPRQLTGAVVDAAYTYPFWNWVGGPWSLVKYGVQAVDKRSKTLDQTELLNQAQDPYVTFREAYYQNLEFKVNDGKVKESSQKELSDDVLKEID